MTTLRDKLDGLPEARKRRIQARTDALIAEERSLRQLRQAHKKTQAAVARKLGIGQDGVSRLEQRSDMLISTLRDYVAALGGSIRLVVAFEGQPDIELHDLGSLADPKAPGRRDRPVRASEPNAR